MNSRALLATSFTGRVLSESSDNDDLHRNVIVTDSDFLNKLMLEMPWLLSCCRNRIIAGSTRQLPIPNIIFHAYKVCQLASLHEKCSNCRIQLATLRDCKHTIVLLIVYCSQYGQRALLY
jgi:hypothetical protein